MINTAHHMLFWNSGERFPTWQLWLSKTYEDLAQVVARMCWHVPIGAHTCALRTICCFQFTCGPEHAAQRPAPRPPAQPPRAISVRRPTPARALGRTRRRRLSRRRRPHPPTRLSYGELANSCLTNSLNCGTCGPSARAASWAAAVELAGR